MNATENFTFSFIFSSQKIRRIFFSRMLSSAKFTHFLSTFSKPPLSIWFSPLARAIYPEVDDTLYTYNMDDNRLVEPEHYVPIVPMILINGSKGIGTGWSSHVPKHDIQECIQNIRLMLNGKAPKGNIFQISKKNDTLLKFICTVKCVYKACVCKDKTQSCENLACIFSSLALSFYFLQHF